MGLDSCHAVALGGGMVARGQLDHGADQIDSAEVGVLRFDQAGVDVNEDRAVLAQDHIGRESAVPAEISSENPKHRRTSGRETLRLWLAPPPAPSTVRSLAWKARSDPWSNTDWHMARGPWPPAWTSTFLPVAAHVSSPWLATLRTPPEAVPIGSFTKAGNRSQSLDVGSRLRLRDAQPAQGGRG